MREIQLTEGRRRDQIEGAGTSGEASAQRVRGPSDQAGEIAATEIGHAAFLPGSDQRATASREDDALRSRTSRLIGTLDAARVVLAKLEAEVRWARKSGGIRQYAPAAVFRTVHQLANGLARRIRRSQLFDIGWYLYCNPDVEASGEDPILHYLRRGSKELRDPNPFFSTEWYLENQPDVRQAGLEPFCHYIRFGAAEQRDPHPLFSVRWYLIQNNDVARSGADPLLHYISCGAAEGRDPHPWFRTNWYLAQNPEVARSGLNPLFHYITCGVMEGRDPHPWFRADWHLAQLPRLKRPERDSTARAHGRATDEGAALLPRRARSSIAPALGQLLRMFHGESAIPVVENDLDLIGDESGRAATIDGLVANPLVALITEKSARLADRDWNKQELDATVIIEADDRVGHNLICLHAVLSLRTELSFEIILADNGVREATRTLVERVAGVVRYCGAPGGRAAAGDAARGKVLVFLSAELIVLPNWLDALLATLKSDRSIGLTGSKCVNVDGSLRADTGTDARSGSDFGSIHDACAPQNNFLRDASDISLRSIAITKELWDQVGRGDDLDLAARVRAVGLRTVYQPHSAVIDHQSAPKRPSLSSSETSVAKLRVGHILVVDHAVPQPDRDAGSRSTVQYLEMFARAGFHVTFWPQDLYFDPPYVLALQRLGIEVIYGWSGHLPTFEAWLERSKSSLGYAYLFRPTCAVNFIDLLRTRSKAKILFAGVDVHYKRLEMELEVTGRAQLRHDARRMEKLEKEIWRGSDVVYYLSGSEVDLVRATYRGKRARTLPIFMFDRARLHQALARVRQRGVPQSRQLLFVGGFRHSPNLDAMIWFVGDIWPIIVSAVPDARLFIVGASPPPAVQRFESGAITVSGAISDDELTRLYVESAVAIVPLRFGAGVKGKLLEAMSHGTPVVTTSIGIQGLSAAAEFIAVRDEPGKFAQATVDVLRDPGARLDQVIGGLRYLQETLTEAAALKAMSTEVPELGAYLDALPRDSGDAAA
jgi:glycosyltransferase involved in cell wall biosynthesis